MIKIKTTEEIKELLELDKGWVALDELKEWWQNNSYRCMWCGSVECAACYVDFKKAIEQGGEGK